MDPEEIAARMEPEGIEPSAQIITWFSDPHDTDLREIFELCKDAQNGEVRIIEDPRAPYGLVIVVWRGPADLPDDILLRALNEAGYES